MGHPAEVTNAREALGKYVLQEAAQELFQSHGHAAALAVMGIILPAERDVRVVYGQETMIRDSYAMCVTGQVL
jgi:hypothetical protein